MELDKEAFNIRENESKQNTWQDVDLPEHKRVDTRLPDAISNMPKQLKDLYVWMARVKFYNPSDEVIAAQYANFIKLWLEDMTGIAPQPVRYLPAERRKTDRRENK
jgi:hypothetical protein